MTTAERVAAIVTAHFGIGVDNLSVTTPLSDLSADMLDTFEIGMEIEEALGVAIDDELCASSTVGDFIALVERRLTEATI